MLRKFKMPQISKAALVTKTLHAQNIFSPRFLNILSIIYCPQEEREECGHSVHYRPLLVNLRLWLLLNKGWFGLTIEILIGKKCTQPENFKDIDSKTNTTSKCLQNITDMNICSEKKIKEMYYFILN